MKKLLGALLGVALIAAAGAANAQEVKGKIGAVDTQAKMFALDDGHVFAIADGVSMDKVKVGADVTVKFETRAGKRTATNVQ